MSVDRSITGVELFFSKDEVIVSKTDLKGCLTYTNRVFIDISGYVEEELLGVQHSIIRHPQMPRCIFKLLWETIQSKNEIFAYVINRCKNGDHYWVLAHVTPSINEYGEIEGYHSNRRVPDPKVINEVIAPFYKQLLDIENSHKNAKDGIKASFDMIFEMLDQKGMKYDQFIFSLQN